jgi:hypothetical protein
MTRSDWANLALCAAERLSNARRRSWSFDLPRGEWIRLQELERAEYETFLMATSFWLSMRIRTS